MSENTCFYHRADLDGHCSGAIIYMYLHGDVDMVPWDYGDPIPWDLIEGRHVYIVDLAFKEHEMINLECKASHVTWIDHHATAIRMHNVAHLPGIRSERCAACQLTWEFCFPEKTLPLAINYLSLYDAWKWEDRADSDPILAYQLGMNTYETLDIQNCIVLWEECFTKEKVVWDIADIGYPILKYINQTDERILNAGIRLMFEGYKTLLITGSVKSWAWRSIPKNEDGSYRYQIGMTLNRNKRGWSYSLRSIDPSIDVSIIAQKYGGGGHPGAAGFLSQDIVVTF